MIYQFHPLFLSTLFTAFNRQILQFRMLVHVLVSIMDHKCVFFLQLTTYCYLILIMDYSNNKSDEICFVSLFMSGSPAQVYLWNSQCWKCKVTSWCNRFSVEDGKFLCTLEYLSRLLGYPKQHLNDVHLSLKLLTDLGQPIKAIASAIPPS